MAGALVHGGGVAAAAARYGGQIQEWLDLSTGINPCPPALPPLAADVWHRLPGLELEGKARIAARDFYCTGSILPLPVPGTQSAIQLLPMFLEGGKRAAIVSPTYGEYGRSLELKGLEVDRIGDLADVTPQHGLVVVVNPNNPTGRAFAPAILLALAERMLPWGGMLLVDEAFGDCEPDLSLASAAGQHDNLILFRSFGKFFGMAGVRLGFVIASRAIADRFAEGLGPWAVSGPALALASAFLSGDSTSIRNQIASRKAALDHILNEAGLNVLGGTPLFSLLEHERAQSLHEHLCQDKILTRIFDYSPTWLRIGLSPNGFDDQRLAASLQTWMANGGMVR